MNPVAETIENKNVDAPASARSKAPVFVLGCGCSGTKFLYHTLLSAGGFAVYHAESNAFNLLGLRFGNLANRGNRRKLLDAYYKSMLFERTGLKPADIDQRVMEECRNAGDFLRIVMEAVADKQGAQRWAERCARRSIRPAASLHPGPRQSSAVLTTTLISFPALTG